MLNFNHDTNPYKIDYAVLSAMPEELEYLLDQFSDCDFITLNISQFNFKIYTYQNCKILVSYSGIGTSFASSLLTLINFYFKLEYFFICGTAGGIKEKLQLRDVIIVEKAFEAEMQSLTEKIKNTPFESCLTHPLKNEALPTQYSASVELINICDTLVNKNFFKGTLVSSNTFPAPVDLFEKIKQFNPYAIDMETSAFYQIAWLLNLKILSVRGISNLLNADGSDDNIHESDIKGSSAAANKVLLSILDKLIFLKNKKNNIDHEISHVINHYGLEPHPEGGFFSQVYKSKDLVKSLDVERYGDESRSAITSIYYLLNKNDFSAWHVLKSDELWMFFKGSPLKIHVIDKMGNLNSYILGDPLRYKGAMFQICIPAGYYFSAENVDKTNYSLVGCVVAPGFEYADFKIGDKNELVLTYPQHKIMIEKLAE